MISGSHTTMLPHRQAGAGNAEPPRRRPARLSQTQAHHED